VSQQLFMTGGSTIIDGQIISFVDILKREKEKKNTRRQIRKRKK
jgi:hypothetical protein